MHVFSESYAAKTELAKPPWIEQSKTLDYVPRDPVYTGGPLHALRNLLQVELRSSLKVKKSTIVSFLSQHIAMQTVAVLMLPLLMCGCLTLSTPNLETELVVGVTGNNAPFFVGTEKAPSGLDVELAIKLAERFKQTLRIEKMPAHKLAAAVDDGRIDIVMNGMMVTKENRDKFSFALPYLQNGQMLVVRAEDAGLYRPASTIKTTQKKIAVVENSRGEAYAKAYCPSATIVAESTALKVFTRLADARVDVVIIDAVTANYLCDQTPGTKIILDPLTTIDVAWAADSVNFKLLDKLNAARAAWIRDGSLNEIINRWIPGYNKMGFDK